MDVNDDFASLVLASIGALGIEEDRVNLNGGSIALGHPLGANGARLVSTLCHEMCRRDGRCGLTTMCIGVGQGISAVFERAGS